MKCHAITTVIKGAIATVALWTLSGCAALLGPGSVVAENQVILQNFLLVTATMATTEAAYQSAKKLLQPSKENNGIPSN